MTQDHEYDDELAEIDQSIEARLARLAEAEDDGDDEKQESEALASIRQFEALAEEKARAREADDALFKAQMEEAQQQIAAANGDFVRTEPTSDIEKAAVKIAAESVNPVFIAEMTELLQNAEADRARNARRGTEGFDAFGEPVAAPEPVQYGRLPSTVFNAVVDAVRRDGFVDPRVVPNGYTYEDFNALVQREMGR